MGETTHISWCTHTFNPWVGCTRVSNGPLGACAHCYAANLMDDRYGRVVFGGPGKGVGTRDRTSAANWKQPLKWDRAAAAAGTRPFVFCASLADVFDNAVPPEWRRDLFDLIRATPHLVWLLLTKRPQLIQRLYGEAHLDPPDGGSGYEWPSNAAIGCTVVTQDEADRDIPVLLAAKAALNPAFAFVSMEPLMGPVDLESAWHGETALDAECWGDCAWCRLGYPALHNCQRGKGDWEAGSSGLDWVITGGETDQGPHKARPSHPDWFRSLRDQCAAAGVAYHHKQNGEWAPGELCPDLKARDCASLFNGGWEIGRVPAGPSDDHIDDEPDVYRVGKKAAGRLLDGQVHDARPEPKQTQGHQHDPS